MKPRWLLWISFFFLFAIGLGEIPAGKAQTSASAGQRRLFFSAWDAKRKQYVTDLRPDEIRLVDAGKVQAISSVGPGREFPLTLGLLLDASGSRVNEFPGAERGPAVALVGRLLKNGSRGFVASFNEEVRAQSTFASNPAVLSAMIDKSLSVAPKGGSGLYDSISFCAENIFPAGD
ncbi:MAG: hypothetical protein HY046_05340, partial [Acidobacteria bacterium]|nr:hypothetical protein [Acidobacteriota bacterium]